MTVNEKALKLHEEWQGKIETVSKCPIKTREDLALAYTPGVAEPCLEINKDINNVIISHLGHRRMPCMWHCAPNPYSYCR